MEAAMPTPGPEMDRLHMVVDGQWDMAVTYAPSPMMPAGGTATGQERSYPGPGGFSVVIESSATGPEDFSFKAMGVIVWDAADGAYRLYWFTSISPVAALFTGSWEGEDLTFAGTETVLGQVLSSRHRLSNIKPDSFDYAIDIGPSSDMLDRAITIRYSRAGHQGQLP
jgi:hypothetical protein